MEEVPDEVLQMCLARLPLPSIPRAKAVCKRWSALLDDNVTWIYSLRHRMGIKTDPWTYCLANSYDHKGCYDGMHGHAFDPAFHRYHRMPRLACPQRLQFGTVASQYALYVLGGRSPLNISAHSGGGANTTGTVISSSRWVVFSRVDMYDALSSRWRSLKPMSTPRYAFAAAALESNGDNSAAACLIVAGGYKENGMPLSSAEIYDTTTDTWTAAPGLRLGSGACRGAFHAGKFYVKHANQDSLESFDPSTCRWSTLSTLPLEFPLEFSKLLNNYVSFSNSVDESS